MLCEQVALDLLGHATNNRMKKLLFHVLKEQLFRFIITLSH